MVHVVKLLSLCVFVWKIKKKRDICEKKKNRPYKWVMLSVFTMSLSGFLYCHTHTQFWVELFNLQRKFGVRGNSKPIDTCFNCRHLNSTVDLRTTKDDDNNNTTTDGSNNKKVRVMSTVKCELKVHFDQSHSNRIIQSMSHFFMHSQLDFAYLLTYLFFHSSVK